CGWQSAKACRSFERETARAARAGLFDSVEPRGFSPALHRKTKKPSMSWAFSFVWRRGRDSNPRTLNSAPPQAAIDQRFAAMRQPETALSGLRFVLILS